jgi:predicted anti-sigma-YlaC factor YlaD
MDMDCDEADRLIDACVTGGVRPGAGLADHLAICDACRERFDDARLALALRDEAIPAPRAGFVDAALAAAVRERPAREREVPAHHVGAIAAVVATIGIAIGILLGVQWQRGPQPGLDLAQVQLPNAGSGTVRLLIDSPAEQTLASVSIELASNLELSGFAGQRHVEWQTQLKAGKNLLALPLQLTDSEDSQFEVSVSYGQTRKTIRVAVRHREGDQERAS